MTTRGGLPAMVDVAVLVPRGKSRAAASRQALASVDAEPIAARGPGATPPLHWPQFFDASPQNDVVDHVYNNAREFTPNVATHLQFGDEVWREAPGTFFEAEYGGLAGANPGDIDGVNADGWPQTWELGEFTLAITYTVFIPETGAIVDADIAYNRFLAWSDAAVTPSDKFDFVSTMLHEQGHAAGLAHIDDSSAVMAPSIAPGTQRRSLGAADVAAIASLYPVRSFELDSRSFSTPRSFAGTVASITKTPVQEASEYEVTIDWGDGSQPTVGSLAPNSEGGYDVSGTHKFRKGKDKARIKVTVAHDGTTDTARSRVSLADGSETACTGVVAGQVVKRGLTVPKGERCTLIGARVKGSIVAEAKSALEIQGGVVEGGVKAGTGTLKLVRDPAGVIARVEGDVKARKSKWVHIAGARVIGDLKIEEPGPEGWTGGGYSYLCGMLVDGTFELTGSASTFSIGDPGFPGDILDCGEPQGNQVWGDIVMRHNAQIIFNGNTTAENLICEDNDPAPTGDPNSNLIFGSTSDECEHLSFQG